jgi:hypothetical protein
VDVALRLTHPDQYSMHLATLEKATQCPGSLATTVPCTSCMTSCRTRHMWTCMHVAPRHEPSCHASCLWDCRGRGCNVEPVRKRLPSGSSSRNRAGTRHAAPSEIAMDTAVAAMYFLPIFTKSFEATRHLMPYVRAGSRCAMAAGSLHPTPILGPKTNPFPHVGACKQLAALRQYPNKHVPLYVGRPLLISRSVSNRAGVSSASALKKFTHLKRTWVPLMKQEFRGQHMVGTNQHLNGLGWRLTPHPSALPTSLLISTVRRHLCALV